MYAFGKQTLAELSLHYKLRYRTLQVMMDEVVLPQKHHTPRSVALVVDMTFFGDFGVVVFRDQTTKENLWWMFAPTERTEYYALGRRTLEDLGYTIQSVTADGLPGLPSVFAGIPFQYCHFHARKNITKYLTRNPQTEAGVQLKLLMSSLHLFDEQRFGIALDTWEDAHRNFLAERTVREDGSWCYTHRRLRGALRSLRRMAPYLFTYRKYDFSIPRTTNALEGHFAHIKVRVRAHRGLSLRRKEKMVALILTASSAQYTNNLPKRLW